MASGDDGLGCGETRRTSSWMWWRRACSHGRALASPAIRLPLSYVDQVLGEEYTAGHSEQQEDTSNRCERRMWPASAHSDPRCTQKAWYHGQVLGSSHVNIRRCTGGATMEVLRRRERGKEAVTIILGPSF